MVQLLVNLQSRLGSRRCVAMVHSSAKVDGLLPSEPGATFLELWMRDCLCCIEQHKNAGIGMHSCWPRIAQASYQCRPPCVPGKRATGITQCGCLRALHEAHWLHPAAEQTWTDVKCLQGTLVSITLQGRICDICRRR